MNDVIDVSLIIFTFFTLAFAVISTYNFFTAPRFSTRKSKNNSTKISVLIPARNEEENIYDCVTSILNQNYSNIEILVLNDNSEDRTYEILHELQRSHTNITILQGLALPEGWAGKNWACHQLYQNATGEYYLYVDADVRLQPDAVESALVYMQQEGLSIFTVFPTQITETIGEKMTVPMLNWFLLTLLPLTSVFKSKRPRLSAANGQFICFNAKDFTEFGGFASIYNCIVEDVLIVREFKKLNKKVMIALDTDLVTCKMYNSFDSAVRGFSKSFYKGFGMPISKYLLTVFALVSVFLIPLFLVLADFRFIIPVLFIALNRIVISKMSNQDVFINLLLHPIHILFFGYLGIYSLNLASKKKLEWKNRFYG